MQENLNNNFVCIQRTIFVTKSSEILALVRLSKHQDNFLYYDACLCLVSLNFLNILIAYFIFVLLKSI